MYIYKYEKASNAGIKVSGGAEPRREYSEQAELVLCGFFWSIVYNLEPLRVDICSPMPSTQWVMRLCSGTST